MRDPYLAVIICRRKENEGGMIVFIPLAVPDGIEPSACLHPVSLCKCSTR